MWSAIEVNVGIICACIPTLKPLVLRISPHLLLGKRDLTEKAGISAQSSSGTSQFEATTTSKFLLLSSLFLPSIIENRANKLTAADPVDFITTPDMLNASRNLRAASIMDATNSGKKDLIGFVNFEAPRSMLKSSNLESVLTLTPVILLSVVLGTAYGLLNTLNCHFLQQVELSVARIQVLHSSYYWYIRNPRPYTLYKCPNL